MARRAGHLAAEVLGMIGAGHQAQFQLRSAAASGRFTRVLGWNPHPEMLARLGETAAELGLPFEAVELDRLGAEADVIISITSARFSGAILRSGPANSRPPGRPRRDRMRGKSSRSVS